jgi:hypothetical protein
VPTTGELPFEELRRVSAELVGATEKLGTIYGEFLEKKEDDGGEITEADEQLQNELETLTEAADRLSKRFGEGFSPAAACATRRTGWRSPGACRPSPTPPSRWSG